MFKIVDTPDGRAGYHFQKVLCERGSIDRGFLLTNRGFEEYDEFFEGLLSQYLKKKPNATVLDIGGGTESKAVVGMRKFFGTKAYNIDIMLEKGPGFRADAAELPPQIKNNSIDAAVSVFVLDYPDIESRLISVAEEIERVLKPGGFFFIYPKLEGNQQEILENGLNRISRNGLTEYQIYAKPLKRATLSSSSGTP